jgi:hypothetical protein
MPHRSKQSSPSTHDIRITAENLCQTADDDIRERCDLDVDEVADGLVHDDHESVLVRELTEADKVGTSEQRIRREFAEQRENFALGWVSSRKGMGEGINVVGAATAEEVAPRTPFLQDLERVGIRETAGSE